MVSFFSINHQNATLQERESYYRQLSSVEDRNPFVFLQTCNRIELYEGDNDVPEDVARHLFRVVSGLESALIGERAVQGQVKDAYLTAKTQRKLSPSLHKLFETALLVGKRVREETAIAKGAVSHGNAAIEIIHDEGISLQNARITIIGVNKLTTDILNFLKKKGAKQVILANRSKEKAIALASPLNIEVYSLEQKRIFLNNTDVLICATSAPHKIINKKDVNPNHPFLAIDLSFPRNIDEQIANLAGFVLYNLQDVENKVKKNILVRNSEIQKAEAIIEEGIKNLEETLQRRKQYTK